MKFITRFLVVFAFAVNAFVIQASAAPCPHMKRDMVQAEKTMPCHDINEAKDKKAQNTYDTQHCDGLCLCSFVSASALTLPDIYAAQDVFVSSQRILKTANDILLSFATAPPLQPPKSLS